MPAPHRAERTYGPALERHYQLLLWLIPTLEKMPRSQKFLLGDRLQTQAMQVLDDLVTATYSKNRRAALLQANLGLEKMRFLVRLVGGWLKADARCSRFFIQPRAPSAAFG